MRKNVDKRKTVIYNKIKIEGRKGDGGMKEMERMVEMNKTAETLAPVHTHTHL